MLDQQKIGNYLRELRKQKGLTQEQLAEQFATTSRSVSRWENGSNLPDLSVLVELASFYNVELNEVINGESNSNEAMDENVIDKVVEYADADKDRLRKTMVKNNVIALGLLTISLFLYLVGDISFLADEARRLLMGFSLGLSLVIMIFNIFVFAGKTGCNRTRH